MPLPLVLLDIGQTLTTLYDNLVRPLVIPVAVIVVAIGGFYWMTGNIGDDVRRAGKGKVIIIGAIIGAIIVWFAPDIGTTVQNSLPK